jgi:hypothetical protein
MTPLLTRAVEDLNRLPPDEQDAMACLIMEELADEQRWQAAFEASPDVLERLADQALKEIADGAVYDGDPSQLPKR